MTIFEVSTVYKCLDCGTLVYLHPRRHFREGKMCKAKKGWQKGSLKFIPEKE